MNSLNQVPLVNSTQIISPATQMPVVSQIQVPSTAPIISQVPLAASTPLVTQVPMQTTTPVISQAPTLAIPQLPEQHFVNSGTQSGFALVDEDYRMGRGILDEFRPANIKSQYGVVVPNTTGVVTASALPVATTQVLPTSAVIPTSAVVPSTVVPNGGANALKEFL